MLKAIKIRIYPNISQESYINKLLGCYRFVYNECLERKINAYKEDKTNLGLKELGFFFHKIGILGCVISMESSIAYMLCRGNEVVDILWIAITTRKYLN